MYGTDLMQRRTREGTTREYGTLRVRAILCQAPRCSRVLSSQGFVTRKCSDFHSQHSSFC